MLRFTPLWETLARNGMKKRDLVNSGVITSATLAKLGKDSSVNSDTIAKICKFLHCNVSDVVEFVDE